ncbi:hypothetical protein BT93_H3459 [Corymbia citriodora subsp. variegata]|nr:hypothetical protein BT93_H3459 [Corymbia citriodora subsp. variegata]
MSSSYVACRSNTSFSLSSLFSIFQAFIFALSFVDKRNEHGLLSLFSSKPHPLRHPESPVRSLLLLQSASGTSSHRAGLLGTLAMFTNCE